MINYLILNTPTYTENLRYMKTENIFVGWNSKRRFFDLEIKGHIRMNSLKNHLCSTQIKNKFIKNHISLSEWSFIAQTTYWCWPRSRYPRFSKSPRSKNWTNKTFHLGDFVYSIFLPGSFRSVILCIFRDCTRIQKLCYLMWTILFPQQYNQLVAPW